MYLKKINKTFPDNYYPEGILKDNPSFDEINERLKLHKTATFLIPKSKGGDGITTIQTYPMLEHPVYLLLEDLKGYDPTNFEERMELMGILTIATMLDDCFSLEGRINKVLQLIKEIDIQQDLMDYIDRLDTLEELVKSIKAQMKVKEFIQEKTKEHGKQNYVKVTDNSKKSKKLKK